MRLAVSGAQPLFTLGLLMFALSLVDFLSLLLSPSTYFKIFYFCQKYNLKDTYKIFFFLSCLFDGPLGIAYANMLATTQWPLERAVHLTSLVWVCVVWLPESLMDLSALWRLCGSCVNTVICGKWYNNKQWLKYWNRPHCLNRVVPICPRKY